MRYVEAGGARVSVIGLGTWQFGSMEWGYGREFAAKTAVDITRRALDLGVNLVDTAELYAFGRSETIVGRALRGRREEVFLATKLLPMLPAREIVKRRAGGSLRRLGTDRVDLYQLHFPNPVWPLADTMAGVRDLLESGAVAHAGVSNYPLPRWLAAERALGRPLLSNQVELSLVARDPLRELVPHAAGSGRLVIAYSPLAKGLLSGGYGPDRRPRGLIRRLHPLFRDLERVRRLGDALREVGRPHGATPAQVALAWVVGHPNVVAIPGASSVAQVEENAAAADLRLSPEEDERLRAAAAAFAS